MDNGINQDSHSWEFKLLLKKRIFEIGLDLVIFNKNFLVVRIQFFFTSDKNSSNLGEKTSFQSSIVVLINTNCSSEEVVGNIHHPVLNLHTNPQCK